MTEIGRAISDALYPKVVAVMAAQMGKSEMMLNVIGHRLDDDPVPILYIAPTKSFIEGVFEPRYKVMVDQCASLKAKKRPGLKEKNTVKFIAGVKLRFGWAGSATEMSGDPACKVFVDERDRMADSVDGEGDPVTLADARHDTYPDGQTIVASTPTMGTVDTYVDPDTGLEFWGKGDEIQSATWKLFQEGTMFHWAWPCPHCDEFFIPRFRLLQWSEGSTPYQAKLNAKMLCPNCDTLIDQTFKDEMNARGVYVAPGQRITKKGKVAGTPPQSDTISFWVSGLASAWKSWGDRAQAFLQAVRSGDSDRVQAVINTGMGELYNLKGEAPDIAAVKALRQPYKLGTAPKGVKKIILSVDVQKASLFYVVRGWGAELESWQIEHGFLVGSTDGDQVWQDLAEFKDFHYDGLPIDRTMVDSGYRTQFVYAFCRKFRSWAFPTKGRNTIDATPLQRSKLDVATTTGRRLAGGLGIWHVNTDFFKRWVHERIERDPELPGGFHLAEDSDDDYCKQLVSEARIVKPSGKILWQRIFKDNHYFDCEVLSVAGAYSLQLQTLTKRSDVKKRQQTKVPNVASDRPIDPFRVDERHRPSRNQGWFSKNRR
jgi:phage terminase large subunit GpA-like protein